MTEAPKVEAPKVETEIVLQIPEQQKLEEETKPVNTDVKYFIGAILLCDAGLTYAVIDTFKNSCVVEPINNEGCFASEIMSFRAMEQEGWKIIGKQL